MALARILSRYPQQASALAFELQQKGYTVEVLNPEQTPATAADLEIELEAWEPGAPGPPDVGAQGWETAQVLRRAEELASQLRADIAIAPGVLPVPSPVEEPVSAPTAAAAAEPAAPKILLVMRETEAGNCEPAPAVSPALTQDAEATRESGSALAALAAAAGQFLWSARAAVQERLEQAQVSAAEAGARRQERLLELARRRAELRQRALTAEGSRRALAIYLLQLQRQYPDLLPGAQSDAESQPASPAAPPSSSPTLTRGLHLTKWQALLAIAASATAIFVAGLAVASFHSRPASPSTSRDATAQSSAFSLRAPQPKPASPQRPSPAARKTTAQPPAQVQHRFHRPKPLPQDQELVARDVVVRHFPAPRMTPTPQTTGWKHFSDLSH